MQRLTNSRLATFRACPRKHQLRYEIGVDVAEKSEALRVGTAFHAAQEALDLGGDPWKAITELGELDDFGMAMVAAMVTVHAEVYVDHELAVVATELPFEISLRNPDTGAESRLFRLCGKIDRLVRLPDGRLALWEYKTTTEDIAPGSDYWLRVQLDLQSSIYTIAARELGFDVSTTIYDVTARPLQRPYKRTPDDKIQRKKDGTPYANTRLTDETPEEYCSRVADAMRSDPNRYFVRHEIARLDNELAEARAELWHQQIALRNAQRTGRWFRNPGACLSPFPCAFLPVCRQQIDRDHIPHGFVALDDVHQELASPGPAGQADAGPSAQPASPGPAGQSE